MITIIAAMTKERVIGYQNSIPWHLPEDLKHFKHVTLGKPIIMGRKTYESIGRPLPKRHNIVVSQTLSPREGITVVASLTEALDHANTLSEHSFIIGGAALYKAAMEVADNLYISCVPGPYTGDRHFPEIDPAIWKLAEEVPFKTFVFKRFERKSSATAF
jgi:dihydrofolate reductase